MRKFWSFFSIFAVVLIGIVFGINIWREGALFNNLERIYAVIVSLVSIFGGLIFIAGITLLVKLKKLGTKAVSFEEEDIVSETKDKTFADVTLCLSISMALFLFAVASGFIMLRDSHPVIVFIPLLLLGAAFLTHIYVYSLLKKIYPERQLPEPEDEHFEQRLLDTMDDGEKHVMFVAYHKIYSLINPLLFFAILAASIYSSFSGESQIFSIAFMTAMLIIVDTTYLVTVRNK